MQLPTSFGAATYFLSATPPRMRNRTVTSQPPFVSVSVCKPSCVCVCVKMKKKLSRRPAAIGSQCCTGWLMKCGNAALASIKLLSATQFSLSSDEEGASDEDNRSSLTV